MELTAVRQRARQRAKRWSAHAWAFIRLGRFLFLVGGFVMYGLGVAIAWYSGARLNWPVLAWGQLIVTATQLMVHYSNDYFDFAVDQANETPTRWSGGSRVLTEGRLASHVARNAAIALGAAAFVATLMLGIVMHPGPLAVPMLLLALFLCWSYSAPPLRLHSQGLGELTSALAVTTLTPLIGFYLQTGYLSLLPALAILPLCSLQFNMLVSVEIPDADSDAASGKYNLVARYGRAAIAWLYNVVLLIAYVLLPVLVMAGLPPLVVAALSLGLPFAIWRAWRMWRGDWSRPAQWGTIAFFSIALLIGSAVLELAAFIVLKLGGSGGPA